MSSRSSAFVFACFDDPVAWNGQVTPTARPDERELIPTEPYGVALCRIVCRCPIACVNNLLMSRYSDAETRCFHPPWRSCLAHSDEGIRSNSSGGR